MYQPPPVQPQQPYPTQPGMVPQHAAQPQQPYPTQPGMVPQHGGGTVIVATQGGKQGGGGGMIVAIILIVVVVLVVGSIVVSGILYVWANNLAADGTSTTAGTLGNFRAEDASAGISTGNSDTLMKISWIHADGDLNWAFVSFKIEVGDSAHTCTPNTANNCAITESGGSDPGSWETDEILYLKENNADICGAGGEVTCVVAIYVSYEGKVIAGTDRIALS